VRSLESRAERDAGTKAFIEGYIRGGQPSLGELIDPKEPGGLPSIARWLQLAAERDATDARRKAILDSLRRAGKSGGDEKKDDEPPEDAPS
jgi:hypothetical protein